MRRFSWGLAAYRSCLRQYISRWSGWNGSRARAFFDSALFAIICREGISVTRSRILRGRHIVSVRAFWKAFLRTRMPLWCTASNVFSGPRFVAKIFWGLPNFQGSLLSLRWGTCVVESVAAAASRCGRVDGAGLDARRSYRYGVAAMT